MDTSQVVARIATAFRSVLPPSETELFVPSASQMFDSETASKELVSKRWEEIPRDILVKNRDRISYLTPIGFQFLLPAFLTVAILHPRSVDVLRDNIISLLVPSQMNEPLQYERFARRTAEITSEQARAIEDFFASYLDIFPADEWSFTSNDREKIDRAQEFWRSVAT